VREYLVARYGEFVLLEPRISPRTIALWAAPGFVLVLGLLGIALWIRRRAPAAPAPLTNEEKQRLSKLTDK
jgi:cytochrome c-type biogenesis protein CcmH